MYAVYYTIMQRDEQLATLVVNGPILLYMTTYRDAMTVDYQLKDND